MKGGVPFFKGMQKAFCITQRCSNYYVTGQEVGENRFWGLTEVVWEP